MTRRITNSPPTSLTETPDITPGTWVYEPGDSGDSSVGLQGYAPSIQVEIPGSDGDFCELAEIREPVYSVPVPPVVTDEFNYQEYDTGERYLPGSPDRNGLLMAGAPGLLKACQTLLRELYDEHTSDVPDPYSDRPARIKSQILVLEAAIRQAIVFPEGI